jgi:hypothetical protein
MESLTSRKLEFVCRKCGRVVSCEEYKLNHYCPNPDCKTLLNLCPLPKYWMFQFNPKIYRWFDRIRDTQEPEQWLTSQHSKYIHKGDLVAIWASGEKAAINALGQIITDPSKAQLKVDQVKYWIDKANISKFQENKSVLVKYLKIIKETPLLEDECQNNPTLLGLQVFINPQGTNFSLQYEQWQKITELIEKSNQ